ncbi:MAG: hypothetical protein HeimC2_30890 [Candidatus Heimdallarchaeota archaeon LC_2]|nr:MAG: hypothetical protein HeimC2_30890 [Candidatus Heimdallarchaeota archaeon LC_2]
MFSTDIIIHEKLVSEKFRLLPLLVKNNELDYNAVMEARLFLNKLTDGRWPTADFTLDQNQEDLEGHEKSREKREEITFSIFDSSGEKVIGCIYIRPIKKRLEETIPQTDFEKLNLHDDSASIWYWLVPKAVDEGIEDIFLKEFKKWIVKDWNFPFIAYFLSDKPSKIGHYTSTFEKNELTCLYSLDEEDKITRLYF